VVAATAATAAVGVGRAVKRERVGVSMAKAQ
jgi:hypothetical protein